MGSGFHRSELDYDRQFSFYVLNEVIKVSKLIKFSDDNVIQMS